jgi:DNA-binding GntR family transcriptional regulator
MARADGKLFDLLADHPCRVILAGLLKARRPLTQRELIASLGLSSSTISRRLGELEDIGLVGRASPRAPYVLVFEDKTRELMATALDLVSSATMRASLEADTEARELRAEPDVEVETSTYPEAGESE